MWKGVMWKGALWKGVPLVLIAVVLSAQTRQNPFEKAPANIEEQLRARVTEFYQYFLESKFRKAEQLVAEESKDAFYAAGKPEMKGFRIGAIEYSKDFTQAKVEIVAKMQAAKLVMGLANPKEMVDVPFPSYWKVEEGKWCWYVFNDPHRVTPFGPINPQTTANADADPSLAFKPVELGAVMSGVKVDRKNVMLRREPGAEEKVTITNGLPGNAILSVDFGPEPGLAAKLDRTELKPGEKAALTLKTLPATNYAPRAVAIKVAPTNQTIEIVVSW